MAREHGALLIVFIEDTPAGSPASLACGSGLGTPTGSPPAASAPPMKGKEVSPVLDMQKLRIPAVCLSARGYNMMAAMLRGTCPVPGR